MKAPQSNTGGDFAKHPAGWALGVCTRIIDTGTHWNDQKQKDQRKIMIVFESEKLMPDGDFKGQPFLLFVNFNYSMYQNSMLCQFIEDWRGQRFEAQDQADNFDLSKLLNQQAFMNIVYNDKYVNVQTIGPVPDGMNPPKSVGEIILIDQDDLNPLMVEKLTDKMKERVLGAKEQTKDGNPQNSATTDAAPKPSVDEQNPPPFDDDIPF